MDEGPVRARQIRTPRLSPDGRKLAFTALERVYVMDYPKGTPKRVSAADVAEHHPTCSPDGRQITYVTCPDAEGGHIYSAPASGGTPQRLTRVASFYSVRSTHRTVSDWSRSAVRAWSARKTFRPPAAAVRHEN